MNVLPFRLVASATPSVGAINVAFDTRTLLPVPLEATHATSVPSLDSTALAAPTASRAHFGVLLPMITSPRTTDAVSVSPCVALSTLCAVTLVR